SRAGGADPAQVLRHGRGRKGAGRRVPLLIPVPRLCGEGRRKVSLGADRLEPGDLTLGFCNRQQCTAKHYCTAAALALTTCINALNLVSAFGGTAHIELRPAPIGSAAFDPSQT